MLLNALTLSSGAVDAISFIALTKVFSAFMTGNLAFFGLGLAGAAAPPAGTVLVVFAAFAIGVYTATLIVKPADGSRVWTPRVTFALAISLVPHALFVYVWLACSGQPSLGAVDVLLGLWALAMGMQSAAVRRLHVDGVFTTAATATIIDLFAGFASWSTTAAERRRLSGVLASLLIGATAGGFLLVHARYFAPILPFLVTIGVVLTAAIRLRERKPADTSPSVEPLPLGTRRRASCARKTRASAHPGHPHGSP